MNLEQNIEHLARERAIDILDAVTLTSAVLFLQRLLSENAELREDFTHHYGTIAYERLMEK